MLLTQTQRVRGCTCFTVRFIKCYLLLFIRCTNISICSLHVVVLSVFMQQREQYFCCCSVEPFRARAKTYHLCIQSLCASFQEIEVRWSERPVLRWIQRVIVHKYFSYFGIFVAFCNVIVISVSFFTLGRWWWCCCCCCCRSLKVLSALQCKE